MSDLIERAKAFEADYMANPDKFYPDIMADFAQSERTRIAAELEALSQKTPLDAMVTALLEYADGLRQKND